LVRTHNFTNVSQRLSILVSDFRHEAKNASTTPTEKNNFGIKNGCLGSQSKKGTAVKDNQENTNKSRVKGPSE